MYLFACYKIQKIQKYVQWSFLAPPSLRYQDPLPDGGIIIFSGSFQKYLMHV